MAKIVARFDFYEHKWGSVEADEVFEHGTDEKKREWLLENYKCENPDECELDEVFDDIIGEGDGFMITYGDYGMIEEIKLIEL